MARNGSEGARATVVFRVIAWGIVATMFAFLFNNYLTVWRDWPGAATAFGAGASPLAWVQVVIYGAAIVLALVLCLWRRRSLREDSQTMTVLSAYIVRVAFFAVLLVGLGDMLVSFLRVEGLLEGLVGQKLNNELAVNAFRAPYVHLPLILAAFVIAALARRTLGFTWLALLVVVAELQIVISRFIFSYEQAFMGDLVRFWYAALFLFASAYTLLEDGHVRVDVLYTNFSERAKGLSNAIGSLVLGIALCWVILFFGLATKSSVINGPVLSLEVSQSGFGMYVKYLMAAFLGVFAVTMMIQFCGYLLESIADYRGEPGKRRIATAGAH